MDEETAKLNELEKSGSSKSSLAQSNLYVTRFKKFLQYHRLRDDLDQLPAELLCQYLRFFYSELRNVNGQYLSPSTLGCARAGIHRYLTSAPINRKINIMNDAEFLPANRMLKVMGTLYLRNGGRTTSFMSIQD